MARRGGDENREAKTSGRRASVAKVGRMLGPRRSSERESASVGSVTGRSEAHAKGDGHLHQQIAERAFFMYERSGFQDGKELEHWLEAERQVKGEQAA